MKLTPLGSDPPGVYADAFPELEPGNTAAIEEQGHLFHVTATKLDGFHSGRRRYIVECVTCKVTIHPATTGPRQNIAYHLKHPSEPGWPK